MAASTHRRRARRGEQGFSAALTGLLLLPLLMFAGIAVDVGSWLVEGSQLRQAADAAALAGVTSLPRGDAAAIGRARAVAADNGYVHGTDGVSVDVSPLSDESLRVTITVDAADQYLSNLVRGPTSISRTATAEYVQPVPLGSPRNYLGTGDLLSGVVTGDGVEGFWLSASGGCTRREFGDRITPLSMAGGNDGCTVGSPPHVRANPEFDPAGYVFGVTVPEASGSTPVAIQVFDLPTCPGSAAGDGGTVTFDVEVAVYRGDALEPLDGTELFRRTVQGGTAGAGHCAVGSATRGECASSTTLRDCWYTLATVSAPGDYYVQLDPVFVDGATQHDDFSLRARRGATFVPCTTDPTAPLAAVPMYDPTCPQVHGFEHLPVFANLAATDPAFFLASIDARHNGKRMEVTLYDAAEGGTGIELLDPTGTPVSFEWDVLCADGSERTGSCPYGEQTPTGGWGGGPTTLLDVSGSGTKTFPTNSQGGKYSDRLLRLSLDLPDDVGAAYGGRTWWKIRYTGTFGGDRTTWSVRLIGDPVRLVPSS